MTLPTETLQDNGEELITLTRMLRRSRGKFALAFARCNSPAGRQVLVERLREALDAAEISFQEVTLNTTENIISQLQGVAGQDEGQPVFIYGIEFLLPSDRDHHATLVQLNERREKFQKLARPLIFWLPEFALQEIATKASDFWAWRSGVYRFEIETEMRVEDFRVATGDELWRDSNLSEEEKNARLSLLLGLAQDYSEDDPISISARANIYYRIGYLRKSLGDFDNAMIYYQKLLEISESSNNLAGKSAALSAIANIFKTHGNLEHAMQLYQDAIAIEEKLGDLQNKTMIIVNIADILVDQGELEQAMQLYKESLKTMDSLNNLQGKSVVLNNIANIYDQLEDFKQALSFYEEALKLKENLGDITGKANTLHNMATVYVKLGDLKQALKLYNDALKISKKLGDLQNQGNTLHGMAVVNIILGDLERASALYKNSLEIFENIGDLQGKASTLAMMAQVDALQGNHKKALSELIEAKQILMEMGAILKVQTCENNIIILKSMIPPDIFPALWTEVTGEETLPEWLMEIK